VLTQCAAIAKQTNTPVVLSIDPGKRNFTFWLGTVQTPSASIRSLADTLLVFWAWGTIDCGAHLAYYDQAALQAAISSALFVTLEPLVRLCTRVVIEKQMRVNGAMCKLGAFLAKTLRARGKYVVVRHAASKFITCSEAFHLRHSYSRVQRKLNSVAAGEAYLARHPHLALWCDFLKAQDKKDDFTDSMWLAMDDIVRSMCSLLYTPACASRVVQLITHPKEAFKHSKKERKKAAAGQRKKKKQKTKPHSAATASKGRSKKATTTTTTTTKKQKAKKRDYDDDDEYGLASDDDSNQRSSGKKRSHDSVNEFREDFMAEIRDGDRKRRDTDDSAANTLGDISSGSRRRPRQYRMM
jgi:hypothetical protein